MLRAIKRGLAGQQVVCVQTAALALAEIRSNSPDVVLCDYLMPDTNGLELIRQIKSAQPDLRCILMTGYTEALEGCQHEDGAPDEIVEKSWNSDWLAVLGHREKPA